MQCIARHDGFVPCICACSAHRKRDTGELPAPMPVHVALERTGPAEAAEEKVETLFTYQFSDEEQVGLQGCTRTLSSSPGPSLAEPASFQLAVLPRTISMSPACGPARLSAGTVPYTHFITLSDSSIQPSNVRSAYSLITVSYWTTHAVACMQQSSRPRHHLQITLDVVCKAAAAPQRLQHDPPAPIPSSTPRGFQCVSVLRMQPRFPPPAMYLHQATRITSAAPIYVPCAVPPL